MTPDKNKTEATKTPGIRSKGEKTDRDLWEELKKDEKLLSSTFWNGPKTTWQIQGSIRDRIEEIKNELGSEKVMKFRMEDLQKEVEERFSAIESRLENLERRRWFW